MNLYHLNTGVDSRVLLNADYDIRRYTDFISNAIKFLEKETLFIKVKKHIAEIETTINGEKKITKETRYIPETAKNKREEKAIEILFNENTRNIFEDDDSIEKSLNFLYDYNEKSPNEFQYIVTLNSDLIELASQNNKLSFNVNDVKRASFTKEHRFLGLKYNETK